MCANKMVWIFVYGTLKTGGELDRGWYTMSKPAEIKGATLYMMEHGWFPFAKVDNSESVIKGELQLFPQGCIRMLDQIEGPKYERREVITQCGIPCQMYHFKGDPIKYGLETIKSGEFNQKEWQEDA